MLREEFEERTGVFIPEAYYNYIEKAYADSALDKDEFCKLYKRNKDGLAERIRDRYIWDKVAENSQRKKEHEKKVADLEAEVSRLTKELERELEWKPYEDNLLSDEQYEKLAADCKHEPLTDYNAMCFVAREFGFQRESIEILHEKPVYEINRHNQLRKIGKKDRFPYRSASDWNYVLFECRGITYEVVDGMLKPYAI